MIRSMHVRCAWPHQVLHAVILPVVLAIVGCGDARESADAAAPADVSDLRLAQDPGAAASIRDARARAPLDDIVVVGRVSGLIRGFAAFQLTDDALEYCGRVSAEDGCATPWDYCCLAADEVRAHTLLVELPDAHGEPRAGSIPDLRPLDLVAVRGALQKDEHGNVTLVASGYHRRERPEPGAHVKWPQ